LILKSPSNTGRIKFLLKLFPDAKFVHIIRHPAKVLVSTLHLHNTLGNHLRLQTVSQAQLQTATVKTYQNLYSAFLKDKELLKDNQLFEIKYEDFIGNEMAVLPKLYDKLEIPFLSTQSHAFQTYLASISSYKTNTFERRSSDWVSEYKEALDPYMKIWGYTW
jgi:hypothetical protein